MTTLYRLLNISYQGRQLARSVVHWNMPAQRNKKKGRNVEIASHPYSKTAKKKKHNKKTPAKTPRPQHIKKADEASSPQPTNNNVQENVVAQPVAPGIRKRLQTFFSQYSDFQYKPSKSSVPEFHRLCKEYEWERDGSEEKAARYEFDLVMKKEFDALYGSDEKDINSWYKLCHVLSIDPFPNTLNECRAAVLKKHVNLVDLVEKSREDIQIFESEEELSEYTRATSKFFPKESLKEGGVLRALRRHILAPGHGHSRHRISRRRTTKDNLALFASLL